MVLVIFHIEFAVICVAFSFSVAVAIVVAVAVGVFNLEWKKKRTVFSMHFSEVFVVANDESINIQQRVSCCLCFYCCCFNQSLMEKEAHYIQYALD